jgi:hypothetical protein
MTTKPPVSRTAPIRKAGGLYRSPAAAAARRSDVVDATAPRYSTTLESGEDAVVYGVRAGYRVLDAQLARGARYARDLRERYARQHGSDGAASEASEDLLKSWGRFGGEIGETLLKTPDLVRAVTQWLARGTPKDGAAGSRGLSPSSQAAMLTALVQGLGLTVGGTGGCATEPRTLPAEQTRLRCVVVSASLECDAEAWLFRPIDAASPVRASAATRSPPGPTLTIATTAEGADRRLKVHVPDAVPAGTYHALLVDGGDQPCGWVRVTLSDR